MLESWSDYLTIVAATLVSIALVGKFVNLHNKQEHVPHGGIMALIFLSIAIIAIVLVVLL